MLHKEICFVVQWEGFKVCVAAGERSQHENTTGSGQKNLSKFKRPPQVMHRSLQRLLIW